MAIEQYIKPGQFKFGCVDVCWSSNLHQFEDNLDNVNNEVYFEAFSYLEKINSHFAYSSNGRAKV